MFEIYVRAYCEGKLESLLPFSISEFQKISKNIFVMQNGLIVESGPAKQVFSNPEEDYTDRLLNAALRYSTV